MPIRHAYAPVLMEVLQELLAHAHGIACTSTRCIPQPSSVRACCIPFLDTIVLWAPLSALDEDLPRARHWIEWLDSPDQ